MRTGWMRAALASLGLLAGCSDGAANRQQAPRPAAQVLTPLAAAEIRARLPGHVIPDSTGECRYAPILIYPGGRFEAASSVTGHTRGEYDIGDGVIFFNDHGAPDGFRVELRLFHDEGGRLYVLDSRSKPVPLRLDPADPRVLDEALSGCLARLRGNAT